MKWFSKMSLFALLAQLTEYESGCAHERLLLFSSPAIAGEVPSDSEAEG
jgi:hypothetical protein